MSESDIQSRFIQLETEARHADRLSSLFFIIANSTKKLFDYHQAVVWVCTPTGGVSIETVSGTGTLNKDAPYLVWLKRVFLSIEHSAQMRKLHRVNRHGLPTSLDEDWDEYSPPNALWCPLLGPNDNLLGGIWFCRDEKWSDDEMTIIHQLSDAYAHAWHALAQNNKRSYWEELLHPKYRRRLKWVGVSLLLFLLFPIRQTTLAPAEIAPEEPFVISSPVEGVVANIFVDPNQDVRADQKLFTLDDTKFTNQYHVAEKALQVAQQKYRKAGQHAFSDKKSKSELTVFAAEVEKQRAELDYAKSLLDKITIHAPRSGVVIYTSKQDWIGKPVTTGEKVMTVADPDRKEIDIWLPVEDAIKLKPGSKARLFLNVDPLDSMVGKVKYVSYSATERPDGSLAYHVRAEFLPDEEVPRIGLKGTAKLYGQRVVLVYYLLWRPISAARRFVGI